MTSQVTHRSVDVQPGHASDWQALDPGGNTPVWSALGLNGRTSKSAEQSLSQSLSPPLWRSHRPPSPPSSNLLNIGPVARHAQPHWSENLDAGSGLGSLTQAHHLPIPSAWMCSRNGAIGTRIYLLNVGLTACHTQPHCSNNLDAGSGSDSLTQAPHLPTPPAWMCWRTGAISAASFYTIHMGGILDKKSQQNIGGLLFLLKLGGGWYLHLAPPWQGSQCPLSLAHRLLTFSDKHWG